MKQTWTSNTNGKTDRPHTSSGSVNPACWSFSSPERWTCFPFFSSSAAWKSFLPAVEIKQTTPAAEIRFLLLFQIDSEGGRLSCSRIKAQSSEWVRERVWYTVKDSSHTHCLIVVNLTTVLTPAVLVGNVSKAQRDSLLYLSLSFSEAGFLVITLPPSHTHTPHPLLLSYMWFSLKSSEQQGPTSLFFVSFFAAFPCYSGSCGLPRGGMKDDTLNTPPSAPPQNIHYWNILNSSPTFQLPSKCPNSTLAQKKTWNIIKNIHKSTDIGEKYSLSYGCKEFCLVYILYLNVLVTFVHQHWSRKLYSAERWWGAQNVIFSGITKR